MLPALRSAIEVAIVNVQGWGRALFAEPTPLKDLGALTMPVLAQTVPRLQTLEFEGLGHMGLFSP